MLSNKRLWRATAWPVLFITTFFLAWAEHWDPVYRAWAQQPPDWPETGIPGEYALNPELRSQASSLENHPVLIYEFVRNEVEYEPYSGSRFGALGTLHRRRGNDVDQSLLLAGLLRAAYYNLMRDEPDLWFVRGDVRLTGQQALDWLGVSSGAAVESYLNAAGVPYRIAGNPAAEKFELTLVDHVWLRGDLEFGPYRGARFVAGDNGILADLDPSFVMKYQANPLAHPFDLSGLDPVDFASRVTTAIQTDAASGSARNIPEALMLDMIRSGAGVFRNYLDDRSLTPDQALENRLPAVGKIESLPDALPYTPVQRPETYKLKNEQARDDFMGRVRHRTQLRIVRSSDNTVLVEAIRDTAELYGKTWTVGFESAIELPTSIEELTRLPNENSPALNTVISLDGATVATSNEPTTYGQPIRIEFAYQEGSFATAPLDRTSPLDDASAVSDVMDTMAGGLYAFATVPGLNSASQSKYYNRALNTAGISSASVTAALGPSLDLAAQVVLSQSEDMLRAVAAALGHRVSSVGQWCYVGLEPVADDSGSSIIWTLPRFVLGGSEGSLALGNVAPPNDPRQTDSNIVQSVLQLARDAQLSQGLVTAFGDSVLPVAAGRLVRDANAKPHPEEVPGSPTYAVDSGNAQLLLGPQSADRVPQGGNLALNLQSRANEDGDLLLMPSVQTSLEPDPSTTNTLGLGWGWLSRHNDNTWSSMARTTDGLLMRSFSDQRSESPVTPASLVSFGAVQHYRNLADKTINGTEAFLGTAKSTLQAFIVSALPLAKLVAVQNDDAPDSQASKASGLGAAIVLLNAMLPEFARPVVVDMQLQLGNGSDPLLLDPSGVFNPLLHETIQARSRLSQIVERYEFRAYDGSNLEHGAHEATDASDEATVFWTMKDGTASPDVFDFVPNYNGSDPYNGPLQIRIEGEVNGQKTRQTPFEFTIDTLPPALHIIPWDQERQYSGQITIRGAATDLHFESYTVEIAQGETPSPEDFRIIGGGSSQILGAGTLAIWNARDENANGTHTIRLSAVDRAGNDASMTAQLSVRNDLSPPVVNILSPSFNTLNGTVTFNVEASDNATNDSGLKRLKIWAEYKTSSYEKRSPSDPFNDLIISDAQEVWLDDNYGTASIAQKSFTKTIDTKLYQAHSQSPLTLHIEAYDHFDNANSPQTSEFTLNNSIFNAYLTPSAFGAGGGTEILVFSSNASPAPTVHVQIPPGTPGILASSVPLTRVAFHNFPTNPETALHVYRWNGGTTGQSGSNPPVVPEGHYTINVAQSGESVDLDVFRYLGGELDAFIESPRNTILLKDKTPVVSILGFIECDAFDLDTTRPDTAPIERLLPASRPYWRLAYKSHDVAPLINSLPLDPNFFTANFATESNWREIDHGFSERPDGATESPYYKIADWNIRDLPTGTYDLRLTVTDGVSQYLTGVVAGYKITNSSVIPGEDPDDREPGVLKLRQVDFSVPFEGFPVEIARNYNSFRSGTLGDFGYGWNLDGITLDISQTRTEVTSFGERLEATITLPDGRKFNYANEPATAAQLQSNSDFNAWIRHEAFSSRPYGQMLWLPGRDHGYQGEFNEIYPGDRLESPGYIRVEAFRDGNPAYQSSTPDGSIACLQLENGSFILFEWLTGKILQQNCADGKRKVDYTYTPVPPIAAVSGKISTQVLIQDHLGRNIKVERDNASGLVTKITDPRGFFFKYEYNAKNELARVYDRNGNLRELFYGESVPDENNPGKLRKMPEHYLTRMLIHRTDADGNPNNTEIKYEYEPDGRLGGIDTGDGEIAMEYDQLPEGGGIQTVVDETTGGRTEVFYDAAGRATRQVDPAGVVTLYDYNPELPEGATPGQYDAAPPGALKSQTAGGVTTSFQYDLSPFRFQSRGMDQMGDNYLDFWLNRASGGQITDDYESDNLTLRSGYLTNQQVQPTNVATPEISEEEIVGSSTMALKYDDGTGDMPDGSGKLYSMTDPEGQTMGMQYGQSAVAKNEITTANGPNDTQVANAYVPENDPSGFAGRLQQSITSKLGETISTTTYTYDKKTVQQYPELVTHLSAISFDISTVWPNFLEAYAEKHTVQSSSASETSESVAYFDALGNDFATVDTDGNWTVRIMDAEERTIFDQSPGGDWSRTFYDQSGLVTRTIAHPAEGDEVVTEFVYDSVGRRIETKRDGHLISATVFAEIGGLRVVTQRDELGAQVKVFRDSSGRIAKEESLNPDGSVISATSYDYDADGRMTRATDSITGVTTEIGYDLAGRESARTVTSEGVAFRSGQGYDGSGRVIWSRTPKQHAAGIRTTFLYFDDHLNKSNDDTPTTLDDIIDEDDPRFGKLVAVYHEDSASAYATDDHSTYTGSYEIYEYDTEGRRTAIVRPASLGLDENGEEEIVPVRTTQRFIPDEDAYEIILNDVPGGPSNSETNLRYLYGFDSHGNRSSVLFPDGQQKQWTYTYHPVTRRRATLTETILGHGPKLTSYNDRGRPLSIMDSAGAMITMQYGDNGIASKTLDAAGSPPPITHVFTRTDASSTVETHEGTNDSGALLRFEQSRFSDRGTLESLSTPEGTINYTFTSGRFLSSIGSYGHTISYRYDGQGRVKQVESPSSRYEYAYGLGDSPISITNTMTGTRELRQYDGLDRLTSVTHLDAQGSTIYRVLYQLGVDGKRIASTEQRIAPDASSGITRWLYRYDAIGRLVAERRDHANDDSFEHDVAYGYDRLNNRTTVTDFNNSNRNATYHYAEGTNKIEFIEYGDESSVVQTWTPAGQLATKSTLDSLGSLSSLESFSWNADNTLASVVFTTGLNAGTSIAYDYDWRGELVGRRAYTGTTLSHHEQYLVDRRNPTGHSQRIATLEVDPQSGVRRVRSFQIFGETLLAQSDVSASPGQPGLTKLIHADGPGTIQALTSDAPGGNMTPSYALRSAVGERLAPDQTGGDPGSQTGSLTTEYAFGGQPADAATGLQYHRARWLDVGTSHWLSPDPIYDEKNYGNAFSFAGHNPLTHTDPSGLFTLGENTVVNAVIGELTRAIAWEVGGILMNTMLSSAGIDPAMLLVPVMQYVGKFVGIRDYLEDFVDSVIYSVDFETNVAAVAELVQKILYFAVYAGLILEVADTVWSIVELFFKRSVTNAITVLQNVYWLAISIRESQLDLSFDLNPQFRGFRIQTYHIGEQFSDLMRKMTKKINDPSTIQAVNQAMTSNSVLTKYGAQHGSPPHNNAIETLIDVFSQDPNIGPRFLDWRKNNSMRDEMRETFSRRMPDIQALLLDMFGKPLSGGVFINFHYGNNMNYETKAIREMARKTQRSKLRGNGLVIFLDAVFDPIEL